MQRLLEYVSSARFGQFLKIVILLCSYIISLFLAVCGLIVLFARGIEGLSSSVPALAAAIIFFPDIPFPMLWRFVFGGFIVIFLL